MSAPKRVLEWANRWRVEGGVEPLDDLPKGVPCRAEACPLANALKPIVMEGHYVEIDGGSIWLNGAMHSTPKYVQEFVQRFDDGKYPELIV